MVAIADRADVERARRNVRNLTTAHRFPRDDAECVVSAVSELAMNLLRYAHHGEIASGVIHGPRGLGIQIESHDLGPGIPDIPQAFQDTYSTSGGMGDGLPGVVRLMDDVEVTSTPTGTHITARKWLTAPS